MKSFPIFCTLAALLVTTQIAPHTAAANEVDHFACLSVQCPDVYNCPHLLPGECCAQCDCSRAECDVPVCQSHEALHLPAGDCCARCVPRSDDDIGPISNHVPSVANSTGTSPENSTMESPPIAGLPSEQQPVNTTVSFTMNTTTTSSQNSTGTIRTSTSNTSPSNNTGYVSTNTSAPFAVDKIGPNITNVPTPSAGNSTVSIATNTSAPYAGNSTVSIATNTSAPDAGNSTESIATNTSAPYAGNYTGSANTHAPTPTAGNNITSVASNASGTFSSNNSTVHTTTNSTILVLRVGGGLSDGAQPIAINKSITRNGDTFLRPGKCGVNEQYTRCGGICQPTCSSKFVCKACRPGCSCKRGYVRRSTGGPCIRTSRCTDLYGCKRHEQHTSCGGDCGLTCADVIKGTRVAVCRHCSPGCSCKPGFVRSFKGGRCRRPRWCRKMFDKKSNP